MAGPESEPSPRVATVGRGTARAAPDAALLSLEVWAELDTPEAGLDEVAGRTEALQGVLDRTGGGPDMPVESGDVDVAAAVTVVFELIAAEPA